MIKRTILFRADGSPSIGIGHFTRSLALAEMLNKHFHCIFATCHPTEYQIAEIEKICHGRIDLPDDDAHFEQFLTHLKGDEIVVLDNYFFTTDYQKLIKAKGCKLVCVDDLHNKHFVADIVINHAGGIDKKAYSTEPYTELLLGYKYAMLRKDYLKPDRETHKKKYSAIIMMGGADPLNITSRIMEQIVAIDFNKPVAVVSSQNGLEPFKKLNKFAFLKDLNANQVAELMLNSEFGILPASTVAIESCAMRLPFICGYFIGNQSEIYNGIKANNLAICVGDYTNISNDKIQLAIQEIKRNKALVEKLIRNQASKLDKKSNVRLLKVISEL
jgi:UDP-2,4-diacetamido-2,4,6-trideoxy-beta-L-altropyranose hydrolase